jgi:hypothetical protein
MVDRPPKEWLIWWKARYDEATGDDSEYDCLMAKYQSFSADDFVRIGKWKDGATTDARWRPNVASVAYMVWNEAAEELPPCPDESEIAQFLTKWSDSEYIDQFKSGPRKKHFGLSRATTLLHFLSGGKYPIFDSRVKTAVARLFCEPELPGTVEAYVERLLPAIEELAVRCETKDRRKVDKALFAFGSLDERSFVTASAPK